MLRGLNELVEFDDIAMIDLPESDNLPLDGFPFHSILELRSLVHFDRKGRIGWSVMGKSHDGVGALTEQPPETVVSQFSQGGRCCAYLLRSVPERRETGV